eukprot:scaffold252404_cov16-Prasinocladus_malaysianus.AAC.1
MNGQTDEITTLQWMDGWTNNLDQTTLTPQTRALRPSLKPLLDEDTALEEASSSSTTAPLASSF